MSPPLPPVGGGGDPQQQQPVNLVSTSSSSSSSVPPPTVVVVSNSGTPPSAQPPQASPLMTSSAAAAAAAMGVGSIRPRVTPASVAVSGGHRLPFNTHIPVTPVRTDLLRAVSVAAPPPLSSAANNASSCATTLTVGGASLAALPATSVTLTSAPFPVTIRTSTSAPSVQFMPIGTATTGGQAGARVAQTTIRHVKPAMTIPRPPVPSGVSSLPGSAIKYPTVGIGGSQSVATVTISKPLQVMSTGQVPQSIYKPVTITSQQVGPAAAPRQITPQQLQIQPAGQVRMGQRMTMSTGPTLSAGSTGLNVTINPSGMTTIPLNAATLTPGGPTSMARILTQAGSTRLISVPASNVSSGVSIHKATVVSSGAGTKTISLPYGAPAITIPKSLGGGAATINPTGGATAGAGTIPVARVIPQPLAMTTSGIEGQVPQTTNLFITRPSIAGGSGGATGTTTLQQVHLAPDMTGPSAAQGLPQPQQLPHTQHQQLQQQHSVTPSVVLTTGSASAGASNNPTTFIPQIKHGSLSIQRTTGPAATVVSTLPTSHPQPVAPLQQQQLVPDLTTTHGQIDVSRIPNSPRPGILRRRDGETPMKEEIHLHRAPPSPSTSLPGLTLPSHPSATTLVSLGGVSVPQVTTYGATGGGATIITTVPTGQTQQHQQSSSINLSHVLQQQHHQQQQQQQQQQHAPPPIFRPSRGDHEEQGGGGGSSSGSTTLSATSSPCDNANLSGDEIGGLGASAAQMGQQHQQPHLQNSSAAAGGPSPRKKPRKQLMSQQLNRISSDGEEQSQQQQNNRQHHQQLLMQQQLPHLPAEGHHHPRDEKKRKIPSSGSGQKKAKLERTGAGSGSGAGSLGGTVLNKPNLSLLNSYRHTWKSRHNHFVRHSEVKQKEEKRPTVNELANTQFVLQKVNGWKIHLLMSQVDEIIVTEKELSAKLSALQKRLEKAATKDVANKDLEKIKEGIKANLQRSRCLQEQLLEAKSSTFDLFDHKDKIVQIINKYASKRQIRKSVKI